MTAANEFLQYGALGLLAAVLAGVGFWARQMQSDQARIAEEQQKWVQAVAERALQQYEEQTAAWREMTVETLRVQADFSKMLESEFKDRKREHELERQGREQEHSAISTVLQQVVDKLPVDGQFPSPG